MPELQYYHPVPLPGPVYRYHDLHTLEYGYFPHVWYVPAVLVPRNTYGLVLTHNTHASVHHSRHATATPPPKHNGHDWNNNRQQHTFNCAERSTRHGTEGWNTPHGQYDQGLPQPKAVLERRGDALTQAHTNHRHDEPITQCDDAAQFVTDAQVDSVAQRRVIKHDNPQHDDSASIENTADTRENNTQLQNNAAHVSNMGTPAQFEAQHEEEQQNQDPLHNTPGLLKSESNSLNRVRKSPGLCLIIVNYTHDLAGYKRDVSGIEELFTNIDYDVIGGTKDSYAMRDLNPVQFRNKLLEIIADINQSNIEYERLVVFVTSCHGTLSYLNAEENAMCCDISVPEVLDHFHEAKMLANKPKCFIFQGCRSSETPPHRSSSTFGGAFIPSLTNTLVYQCTNLGHNSIMHPDDGSWLMQRMIEVFREHYKTTHLVEMLRILSGHVRESSDNASTISMPLSVNALSRKFFLTSELEK